MIELGKVQTLQIVSESKFGVYLKDTNSPKEEKVLLPKNQVTTDMKIGSEVEAFIYKDSEDRIIATTSVPALTLGEIALLKVKETTQIGAFLDWGLSKDLFLPFKEQTRRVQQDQQALVALYLDKSSRLCATMNVYNYLSNTSPYKKDDKVSGIIYEIIDSFGAYVAVDKKYSAMIPNKELFSQLKIGDWVETRVTEVKEDGRLNLSIRDKSFLQMDTDALQIYKELLKYGGFLGFNDKSSPEEIKNRFNLSKNAFKRAIGHLYKERKITICDDGIEATEYSRK
ncbi:CvfB family protein [Anaeromicropila populeti]|uniref:S1 motif domain-containing protein n=1 Tax=Anaeromicropila populeti TaxID=37658 RepID=A0A1I6J4B2_9FIRM|nr:S1-like domain-containing RNA-binding protein [Anaeromicropila populeti]SFR73320.1 hypothetical protein SAMN05661086_01398 [Anaeromicropila populeti]